MNCESGLYTKQEKYINYSNYKFVKSVQLVKKVRDNLPKGWFFKHYLLVVRVEWVPEDQGRLDLRSHEKILSLKWLIGRNLLLQHQNL